MGNCSQRGFYDFFIKYSFLVYWMQFILVELKLNWIYLSILDWFFWFFNGKRNFLINLIVKCYFCNLWWKLIHILLGRFSFLWISTFLVELKIYRKIYGIFLSRLSEIRDFLLLDSKKHVCNLFWPPLTLWNINRHQFPLIFSESKRKSTRINKKVCTNQWYFD